MRWREKLVVVSVAVAFTLAVSGCQRSPAQADQAGGFAVAVETTVATAEPVQDRVTAVGTLEPNEIVQIKPESEGRVVKVAFREGDPVNKGDVLFQLNDAKLQAAMESAEARATKAKNNLDRGQQLLEQKTISPQEFDDWQAEFKDANALLTLARERFEDATIRSPLDGLISERRVSEGQSVSTDDILVTVVDNDPMKIDFAVPERQLAVLRLGQTVNVTVVALSGRSFSGEIYFIDPRVDPSTRTVKLKATIANPQGELRAGLFANVELVTGTREQAVVIPEQAVVPAIDKFTVFVVENGQAKRREVTLGTRLSGKVEISSGVKPGDVVVVAGQQKLQDGVPVKAMEQSPGS